MAVTTFDPPGARAGATDARTAAARLSLAGAALGAVGVASSLLVVLRLFETWRVGGAAATHHISILGQSVSYPTANLAGVLVLLLAAVGLGATTMAVSGAVREALASRRFSRRLAREDPVPLGDAFLIEDDRPLAFCAGLLRPRVYVSTGALALLDVPALDAVLVHERHHARRRDPLRLAAGRVLARALFFMPGLRELARRHQALAELSADETAIRSAPGSRSALARAMLSFSGSEAVGFDAERVDHLLGETANWRFPALLCLLAASTVVLVVAVALLAGRVAAGTATLAPPFVSGQPCVVVLAVIPAGLATAAVRLRGWLSNGSTFPVSHPTP
jgi:Zn-dependent protease with chaperone function